MPYFQGKEHFWEKKHCHLFGSLGIRRQIEAGYSIIQPKDPFPPEFQALIGGIQEEIRAHTKLQKIIDTLKKNDVSLAAKGNALGHRFQSKKVYPWWYYAKKLKQSFQRYFPEKFDPFADEAIETIPPRDET